VLEKNVSAERVYGSARVNKFALALNMIEPVRGEEAIIYLRLLPRKRATIYARLIRRALFREI